jgi:hypothetical protein
MTGKGMKSATIPITWLTLALLLQLSPLPLQAWDLGSGGLQAVPVPVGLSAIEPARQADFNADGVLESLALSEGQARLLSGTATVWASPADWQVVQAQISDLDGDGQPEASLLVWRNFQAWPVDRWLPHGGRIAAFQDAAGKSCHLILVHWSRGGYRQLWAGSALADPIRQFATADLDGDGRQELVALESRYDIPRSAAGTAVKVWEWNGFGFTLVSSLAGTFDKLSLVRAAAGPVLILVP